MAQLDLGRSKTHGGVNAGAACSKAQPSQSLFIKPDHKRSLEVAFNELVKASAETRGVCRVRSFHAFLRPEPSLPFTFDHVIFKAPESDQSSCTSLSFCSRITSWPWNLK